MTSKVRQEDSAGVVRSIEKRPRRLFAVGDIHGCHRELAFLLNHLESEEKLSSEDLVIFIGDYVDRGTASKLVIDRLIDFKKKFPDTVFLRGNHEDMFLAYMGIAGFGGDVYLSNGGIQTLASYGLPEDIPPFSVLSALPDNHRRFLNELEFGVIVAEFLFVHAGVRPGVPLEQQNAHDLMWIRGEFTTKEHEIGKTVVFGHTPFEDVYVHLPYKIGIDTGLVYGNTLTCIELVEGTLYQVDFAEENVKVASLKDHLGSKTP
jgi:serine/threonine protein phosphatase 1